MKKSSSKVALGGIVASLAILIMFLTGFGPFFTYICPMFAGGLLIVIIIEFSKKWAFATYCAISILSIFTTPDKEAAMLFIFLFGYYPIIKSILEKVKNRIIEWVLKFVVVTATVSLAYWLIINVFGLTQILDSLDDWGKYTMVFLIVLGCVSFVLYDFALSSVAEAYVKWFRPKFLRKLK